ncbi:hypothetical protein [Clostridium hydrogeniformans]|uniref:hypothetical protein n=1 Tax=Clostridium hydrogeniformans TaxID=349933 RepID=UPI000B248165|nr:hypothetical protein [Clostridium hydrogeniformans]
MTKDKDKSNKKVKTKIVQGEKGPYISEVQEFEEPVGYEEAFKTYYPKDKEV